MWLSIRWLQYKLHRFYCSVRHSSSLLFKRLQFDCMSFLHTFKSNSVIVLMLWYPVEVVFCVSRLFQWDSLKFGFKSIFWWQSLQIWLNADRKLHLHHNTAGYKQKGLPTVKIRLWVITHNTMRLTTVIQASWCPAVAGAHNCVRRLSKLNMLAICQSYVTPHFGE